MSSLLKVIRNRLCKFSGEDYTIIKECGNKVQLYFSLIGLLVLVILLCSFASAVYFTDKLFNPNNIGIGLENLLLDIGVGIVWGYIITNMYVLLLYTISPTLLPTKIRKKQEVKTNQFQLSFSMGLRIFIVVLLAIIIAQPLSVLILKKESKQLTSDIEILLSTNSETLLVSDINNVLDKNTNSLLASDIKKVISKNTKTKLAESIKKELDKNSKSRLASDIKHLLATNPLATFITLGVIGIFLLPVYLKYNIRKLGEFYEKKAEIKKRIIEADYKDFKKEYRQIIEGNILNYNKSVWGNLMPFLNKLEKVNPISHQKYFTEIEKELATEKIEKYEYWANPPYRTIHKSRTQNILSEQDLLNRIYPETD